MPIPTSTRAPARQLIRDLVFTQLRAAIVSGEMRPEEVVNEAEVEQWAGASRTPVREALDKLSSIGLVVVEPQKATRVAPLDPAHAEQAFSVLSEGVIGHLSLTVTHLSATQRRTLVRRVSAVRRATDIVGADGLFDTIVAVAGNPRLRQLWNDVAPHVQRTWTLLPESAPSVEELDREALVAAITAASPAAAEGALRAWIDAVDPLAPRVRSDRGGR